MIKARMLLVCFASILTGYLTVYIGKPQAEDWTTSSTRLLGLHCNTSDVLRSIMLTCTLFAGPLYEYLIAERGLLYFPRDLTQALTSWTGVRNYLVGPLTEEFVFRSCIVPLHVLGGLSVGRIIFVAPLYFGVAHIHHIYEKTITKSASFPAACVISLIQFGYTTMFGWLASFLFIRTGSLWICVLVHSFCNAMGLPRVTGRLPGNIVHSIIYYTLLIGGAWMFTQKVEQWTLSTQPYQPYAIV